MFKNNRTNFQLLLENLKEKARLTKNKKHISPNTTDPATQKDSPMDKLDTSGKRKRKRQV